MKIILLINLLVIFSLLPTSVAAWSFGTMLAAVLPQSWQNELVCNQTTTTTQNNPASYPSLHSSYDRTLFTSTSDGNGPPATDPTITARSAPISGGFFGISSFRALEKQMEEERRVHKAESERLVSIISARTVRLTTVMGERDDAQKQLADLKLDFHRFLKQLSETREAAENASRAHAATIAFYNTVLIGVSVLIAVLVFGFIYILSAFFRLQKKLNVTQKAHGILQTALAALRQAHDLSNAAVTRLTAELSTSNVRIAALTTNNHNLQREVTATRSALAIAEEQRDDKEGELVSLDHQLTVTQTQLDEALSKGRPTLTHTARIQIDALTAVNNNLKGEVTATKAALAVVEKERDEKAGKLVDTEHKLAEALQANNNMRLSLDRAREQRDIALDHLAAVEQDHNADAAVRVELKEVRAQRDAAIEESEEYQKELCAVRLERDDVRKELKGVRAELDDALKMGNTTTIDLKATRADANAHYEQLKAERAEKVAIQKELGTERAERRRAEKAADVERQIRKRAEEVLEQVTEERDAAVQQKLQAERAERTRRLEADLAIKRHADAKAADGLTIDRLNAELVDLNHKLTVEVRKHAKAPDALQDRMLQDNTDRVKELEEEHGELSARWLKEYRARNALEKECGELRKKAAKTDRLEAEAERLKEKERTSEAYRHDAECCAVLMKNRQLESQLQETEGRLVQAQHQVEKEKKKSKGAFRHDAECCLAVKKNRQLEAQLEETQAKLVETEAERDEARDERDEAQASFDKTADYLVDAHARLRDMQQQLRDAERLHDEETERLRKEEKHMRRELQDALEEANRRADQTTLQSYSFRTSANKVLRAHKRAKDTTIAELAQVRAQLDSMQQPSTSASENPNFTLGGVPTRHSVTATDAEVKRLKAVSANWHAEAERYKQLCAEAIAHIEAFTGTLPQSDEEPAADSSQYNLRDPGSPIDRQLAEEARSLWIW